MPTKIIGTAPYQVPRNADLGTLSTQDADNIMVQGGAITLGASSTQGYFQDTSASDVKPSLFLDFVNSKSLDARISFFRATTASYYDGSTYVKAEENLITYSQDLSNAAWTKSQVSVLPNVSAAPDGTITAARVTPTTANTAHYPYTTFYMPPSSVHTVSFYAKADGYNYVYSRLGVVGDQGASFNLSNGTVNNTSGSASATITSVGNGWYRCTYTATSNSYTNAEIYIFVSNSGSAAATANPTFAGDGVSGILVWGVQAELKSTASGYVQTTSIPITNYIPKLLTAATHIPRFDHDPITGECKGFYVEGQRSNLITNSSNFVSSYWTKPGTSTLRANATIAPDGSNTATFLCGSSTQDFAGAYVYTAGQGIVTVSIYAKYAGKPYLGFISTSGTALVAFYNLQTGKLGSVSSGYTATMTDVGNGWYRCTLTAQSGSFAYFQFGVTDSDGAASNTGDSYKGIYIWGAQGEAAASASSYIATTGSSVTRTADVATISGSYFSNFYNPVEGTVYADFSSEVPLVNSIFTGVVAITDSSFYNVTLSMGIGQNASNYWLQNEQYTGGVSRSFLAFSPTSRTVKNLFSYDNSGVIGITNTPQTLTSTSAYNAPIVDRIRIGTERTGNAMLYGTLKKIVYYPKRLSTAELQEIML